MKTNITVYVPIFIDPPKVELDLNTSHTDGLEGAFSCQVEGNPRPLVSWHKDGVLLSLVREPDLVEEFRVRPQGNIGFGNYSCSANNSVGKDRAAVEFSGKQTFLT